MLNWDDYGKEENTITAVNNPEPVKVPEIKVEVEVPVMTDIEAPARQAKPIEEGSRAKILRACCGTAGWCRDTWGARGRR